MSLVPSWTYCADEKWYRGLVYRGKDPRWFVCFDDDDPVEIVVRLPATREQAETILRERGIPFVEGTLRHGIRGGRLFDHDPFGGRQPWFEAAQSWFMHVQDVPFPPPREGDTYDDVSDTFPDMECVMYGATINEINSMRRARVR